MARRDVVRAHPFTLIREWQVWLEVSSRAKANANTRRQYRRYLIAWMSDTLVDPLEVTEADLMLWARDVDRHGEMYGMTVRALKSFYRFAKHQGLVKKNPAKHLEIPNRDRLPPPMTSDEDLERFFTAAEPLDPRARPTLELIFATGARLGSIAGVLREDVDLDRAVIRFRVAKNDDPYTLPLGKRGRRAAEQLLDLIDYMPPKVAQRRPTLIGVGPSRIWQWVHEASADSGVPVWTHRLRHEFAHRVANDPRLPHLVASKLMNHKDPRQLEVYALPFEKLEREGVEDL